ncbi:MAG: HAD family phosphatase [Saprospiraceae bacterium]
MELKNKITTLFLDIGGVLLTKGWGHESRYLAAANFQLDIPDMEARHKILFDTYELGKISLDEYLDRSIFYQPRSFSKAEFKEFMFAQSVGFPDMIDLMIRLKKQYGLRIAVVSNEGKELNLFRIKKFNLAGFVDYFVSSSIVGMRKPDPGIFRLALDLAQAAPETVLYFDDEPMFVSIAESLGINAIHQISYADTCRQLEGFGLKTETRG